MLGGVSGFPCGQPLEKPVATSHLPKSRIGPTISVHSNKESNPDANPSRKLRNRIQSEGPILPETRL